MLGRSPSTAREAEGEPAFTVWVLESGLDSSPPIEDHLYILMAGLRDRHDAMRELARRANVEVWLSFSPDSSSARSAILDHRVLAELGDLGIDLVLEPFPPGRGRA